MGESLSGEDYGSTVWRARCRSLVRRELRGHDASRKGEANESLGALRYARQCLGVVPGRSDGSRWRSRPSTDGHTPRKMMVNPVLVPTEEHSSRVVRGGSWGSSARLVRAAYRCAIHREGRNGNVGFRLARGRASAEPTLAPAEPAGAERGTRAASVEDRTTPLPSHIGPDERFPPRRPRSSKRTRCPSSSSPLSNRTGLKE